MVLVPEIAWEYQITSNSCWFEQMPSRNNQLWRTPEEIVEIAFQRSSVVMMNEAHNGMKRCIRTRQIGRRILPIAHKAGVRHLAMETFHRPGIAEQCNKTRQVPDETIGYLDQLEMREFIQAALDLGWTLISYEVSEAAWSSDYPKSTDTKEQLQAFLTRYINWYEEEQALNLITALSALPPNTPMLVWCGNSHHAKKGNDERLPMGYQFQRHSGINHFVIDQIQTVKFDDGPEHRNELVAEFADDLTRLGGTAGFLMEEAPPILGAHHIADAYLLSTQNELE